MQLHLFLIKNINLVISLTHFSAKKAEAMERALGSAGENIIMDVMVIRSE